MKIEIARVESAFDGVAFGNAGPYEKIVGRAFSEVDPAHRLNAEIVHLDKAPRNAAGRVEYWVDFYLLKPVDLRKGNRRLFYDVNNRGNKLALNNINDAPRLNDPATADDAGNGFLMRQGYTLLWSGWQGDVPEGDHRMCAGLPIATNNGAPIVATSRDEFIFDHNHNPVVAPLSYSANTLDQGIATLTVRQREQDPRTPISSTNWRYVSANRIEITRPAGFDAGAVYEFIYPVRDPVAFMRHESADAAGTPNPLSLRGATPPIDYVLSYGASQSGRFSRDFLWQGFNQDLNGRKVFDGMIASVAGSRKTFVNFAFAQPGRFSRQHEDRLFPGDQFPFSYATTTDPVTGKSDGILARCQSSNTCPKIMQTEGSTDFWHGRAGLVVTDGRDNDVPLPEEVRAYLFASIQHGGAGVSANFPFTKYPGNPADYSCVHRALVVALDEWVSRGVQPPASRFPRVTDGTLVAPSAETYKFPAIPGVTYSGLVNELSEMDYSVQPPSPRGTHTGWNHRRAGHAEGELILLGSYFPFAATKQERLAANDPRPSLEERYPSNDHYFNLISRAAGKLQEDRLLLGEDVERIVKAAAARVGK